MVNKLNRQQGGGSRIFDKLLINHGEECACPFAFDNNHKIIWFSISVKTQIILSSP